MIEVVKPKFRYFNAVAHFLSQYCDCFNVFLCALLGGGLLVLSWFVDRTDGQRARADRRSCLGQDIFWHITGVGAAVLLSRRHAGP